VIAKLSLDFSSFAMRRLGVRIPLVHHIPKNLRNFYSALYLTGASLATRSSATISLSRRGRAFSRDSNVSKSIAPGKTSLEQTQKR